MSTYRISSGYLAPYEVSGDDARYVRQVSGAEVEEDAESQSETNNLMDQQSDTASGDESQLEGGMRQPAKAVQDEAESADAYVVAISKQAEELSAEEEVASSVSERPAERAHGYGSQAYGESSYGEQAYGESSHGQQSYEAMSASDMRSGSRINLSV